MQPGRRLGTGKRASVFAYGDDALKLYSPGQGKAEVFREAATLALVESLGLPAPRVRSAGQFDGAWGLAMSRAEGETFAVQLAGDPARRDEIIDAMVALHRNIHGHSLRQLAPLSGRLRDNIARAPALDAAVRRRLLEAVAAMPVDMALCHGDFHPMNIVGPIGNAVVIDWLDAMSGPLQADVARSYLLMALVVPDLADAYMDRYAAVSQSTRDALLAPLPVIAAARLVEDVPEEIPRLLAWAATV